METTEKSCFNNYINSDILKTSFSDFEKAADEMMRKNTKKTYALVCINLCNITFINNVYGATVGSQVIENVQLSVCSIIKNKGIAVRLSSENFVMLTEYVSRDDIIGIIDSVIIDCTRCNTAVSNGFTINTIYGVYTFDDLNKEIGISVREASDRLSAAVISSDMSGGYFFYDNDIHNKITKNIDIVKSVDAAIENNEFQIFLQPQHYLQHEDRVLSAEALVRWIKKDGTIVFPGDFIPVLEKNGLITKLDCHVMELTCKFISEHINDKWFEGIVIAVNVSKVDLKLRDFIEYYTKVRNKYHIPDGRIEIEFTESAVFEDYSIFKQIMFELRKSGFYCSIDDFGTGSSSLNMLKSMPVDVLKMDRMFFVCDNENDQVRNNSVIASVVAMARGLGMKIVAEGIESTDKIDFLRKIGCDVIQGYVYSKPLSTDEFEKYVKNYIPKYLPISEKLNPSPPQKYNASDAEEIYQKYVQVLPYVSALVLELDIEADSYNIISFGQDKYLVSDSSGKYSEFFDNAILKNISPEYIEEADKKISLKGILSAFYRGDSEVIFEMQIRLYDIEEGELSDEYVWCKFHMYFQRISIHSKPMATIYISDIQEQKEQEMSVLSVQSRLKAAIKSMKCDIYDIDMSQGDACLLHTGNSILYSDGKTSQKIDEYINKYVYSDDKDRITELFRYDENKNDLEGLNDDDGYYTEYRVVTQNNQIRWNSIHIMMDYSRGKNNAVAITQDITSYKKLEEKAINTEKTLNKFVSAMCSCVFELKFTSSTVHMIKADNEFNTLAENVTDIQTYDAYINQAIDTLCIHPDDANAFREKFLLSNIKAELDQDSTVFLEYRRMTPEGYRWYEVRLIKSSDSGIVFICNIDERKISELRKERKSRTDKNTGAYILKDFYDIIQEYTEREGCNGDNIMIMTSICDFDIIRRLRSVQYGEQLEINFVNCMRKSIRKEDIIGKYDDGKFVLFLKNISRSNVERFVSKTRSIFEEFSEKTSEYKHFCTGVSILSDNNKSVMQLSSEANYANEYAVKNGNDTMFIYDDIKD